MLNLILIRLLDWPEILARNPLICDQYSVYTCVCPIQLRIVWHQLGQWTPNYSWWPSLTTMAIQWSDFLNIKSQDVPCSGLAEFDTDTEGWQSGKQKLQAKRTRQLEAGLCLKLYTHTKKKLRDQISKPPFLWIIKTLFRQQDYT